MRSGNRRLQEYSAYTAETVNPQVTATMDALHALDGSVAAEALKNVQAAEDTYHGNRTLLIVVLLAGLALAGPAGRDGSVPGLTHLRGLPHLRV